MLGVGCWVLSSARRLGVGCWARPGGRVLGVGAGPQHPLSGAEQTVPVLHALWWHNNLVSRSRSVSCVPNARVTPPPARRPTALSAPYDRTDHATEHVAGAPWRLGLAGYVSQPIPKNLCGGPVLVSGRCADSCVATVRGLRGPVRSGLGRARADDRDRTRSVYFLGISILRTAEVLEYTILTM